MCVCGGGGMNIKGDNSEYKSETTSRIGNNRGTNLAHDMLCEPIISDSEYKEGDKLGGNIILNL